MVTWKSVHIRCLQLIFIHNTCTHFPELVWYVYWWPLSTAVISVIVPLDMLSVLNCSYICWQWNSPTVRRTLFSSLISLFRDTCFSWNFPGKFVSAFYCLSYVKIVNDELFNTIFRYVFLESLVSFSNSWRNSDDWLSLTNIPVSLYCCFVSAFIFSSFSTIHFKPVLSQILCFRAATRPLSL